MAYGLSTAVMPSHSLIRSEQQQQQIRQQQPADQIGGGDVGLRPKRDIVFVVNPRSANGSTGREWKKLLPQVKARLGGRCNICESMTSGPSHAVDITREAIKEGAEAVIAVGGDGTLHEVVNGFFEAGGSVSIQKHGVKYSTALGLIPFGTGSDFARTFGWKNNPHEALDRIAKGNKSKIDVGVVEREGGEPHFFINVADIHLSAKAGYHASKYKRFGNLCYVLGALQGFVGHRDQDFKIKINGGDWELFDKTTAVCIGNAKYFGGGMKITPNADPMNGTFEVVIIQNYQWYDFILKLLKLYSGTHLSDGNIFSRSVYSIELQEVDRTGDIYVQSDGEHLGFLPVKSAIIPGAIEMFI